MVNDPEICPHCGRLGIKEIVDGKILYNHRNTADLRSEPISFTFDYCPKPEQSNP